jgi:hypothetical protein
LVVRFVDFWSTKNRYAHATLENIGLAIPVEISHRLDAHRAT